MILEPTNISIDMIQLSTLISPINFKNGFKHYIDSFGNDPNLEYKERHFWKSYKHNWLWTTENYSFYFAYQSNMSDDNKFIIQYNPNKVDPEDKLLIILLNCLKYGKVWPSIDSFDVAFDYDGITTSDLILDKGRKQQWSENNYGNKSDITYYMGKRGKNGNIKVYDKASEESKGKADYNKTRYEITIRDPLPVKDIHEWKCTTTLCKMYMRGVQGLYGDKGLSPTEKLLVYAVENGFGMSNLTYEQRKRYEKIALSRVEMHTKIEPTQLDVEIALKTFITNLFN